MEAVAHYCQPKENPRKAEEEIALARKVAMIAAKAGARSGCDGLWHEPGAVRQRNERRIQHVW